MADVFLSYSSADRAKAMMIEKALTQAGHSVFWDQEIPPGRDWDSWIRERLVGAKTVVVLWSKASVVSPNVRHEAMIARDAQQLIPVLLDKLAPTDFPMGLYLVQAIQLDRWDGDPGDPAFYRLLSEIAARKSERPPPRRAPRAKSKAPLILGLLALILALGGAGYAALSWDRIFPPSSHNAQVANADLTPEEVAANMLLGSWRWQGIACGEGPVISQADGLFAFTTAGAPTYRHVLEAVQRTASPTVTTLVLEPEEARGTGFMFQREGDRLMLTNRADGRTDEWEKCP